MGFVWTKNLSDSGWPGRWQNHCVKGYTPENDTTFLLLDSDLRSC